MDLDHRKLYNELKWCMPVVEVGKLIIMKILHCRIMRLPVNKELILIKTTIQVLKLTILNQNHLKIMNRIMIIMLWSSHSIEEMILILASEDQFVYLVQLRICIRCILIIIQECMWNLNPALKISHYQISTILIWIAIILYSKYNL